MRKHIMDRILEHPDADGCFLQSGGPIMTFRLVHAETGVIVYPLNPNYCDQWATLDEIELWLNEPRSQGEKIPNNSSILIFPIFLGVNSPFTQVPGS